MTELRADIQAAAVRCGRCGDELKPFARCARLECIRANAAAARLLGKSVKLSTRDLAVLAAVGFKRHGRAPYDIALATPGGRPGPTLVSLERRGLVKLNRETRRRNRKEGRRERIAGAYITMDGLEALLLANPNAEVHER
jgi:hypothetical protein